MKAASGPAKETLRLNKLNEYNILDTLPEPAYNDIVELAAHICQAPTALVSLIDANRQWFKAKVGLEAQETPRDIAFCSYTIEHSGVMVIEDTHQNPRFKENPLVTGPPGIRFYAGAPLVTPEGYALGSLCVIDYEPRVLLPSQLRSLEILSRQVVAQMELSRQANQLKIANETLEKRVQERTATLATALHRLLQAQTRLTTKKAGSGTGSPSAPNATKFSSGSLSSGSLSSGSLSSGGGLKDLLTGLASRSYFMQRLDQSVQLSCRQPSHLYAVLFIDLNDFKPINAALGHATGDRILCHVADQIKQLLRKSDLVARIGGDEFAVLLDDISNEDHAIAAVKRLQHQLETPFMLSGDRPLYLSISIGITFSHQGYRLPQAALKDAEVAMYHAKSQTRQQAQKQLQDQLGKQLDNQSGNQSSNQSGENEPTTKQPASSSSENSPILVQHASPLSGEHFAVFNGSMQNDTQVHSSLENELRQALRDHQFQLYYQPIFNLTTQSVTGFEVLLRWQHPTRGCLEAEEFIAIAEEIGIVRQLCNEVISSATQQLRAWRDLYRPAILPTESSAMGDDQTPDSVNALEPAAELQAKPQTKPQAEPPISLCINLSLLQLSYSGLVSTWETYLNKHQLNATDFQLEIAEHILISDNPGVTIVLHQLKDMGFKLCIDDFGRGHSSLSKLHELDVSTLKIDRAFVRELTSPDDADIVKTILDLGKSSQIEVIAEGIETANQLKTVMALGCQLGQGFWLSEPLSAADAQQLLTNLP